MRKGKHVSEGKISSSSRISGGLGNNEDAHEEDHNEEDPHEKPVHHLGNLLPLGYLGTCGSLVTKAVGNVLDVLHHLKQSQLEELRKDSVTMYSSDEAITGLTLLIYSTCLCWRQGQQQGQAGM